ncbi:hypothetical protein HH310_16835 [Actinoplanes sp. TBRC 11911]|uniref:hypothetical protein n=1 Tax=Actinoplanes sp. TBRC 11911 TaxID=2729386 RepID=UPI00145E2B38|nr:hypothetical protein [Actinoplanes sp. TBRC 11911]NMO52850.1 hypothetical protein [Actinoplanes sp. TBRC 11911]
MTDSAAKWHGRPWWQFVGVLLAAAALVVAILQLVATPGDSPPPLAAPVSVSAATPVASASVPGTPAAVPVTSAATSAPPEGTVRWQGPITFRAEFDTSTDLDKVPPRSTTVDEEGDVHAGGVNAMEETQGPVTDYDQGSRIAEWTGDGRPEFAACRDRALAGGSTEVTDVHRGTVLCVATDKGNVARLTITRVIKFKGFEADAVVWNAPR